MQILELRNQLIEIINNSDESSLRVFFEFLKKNHKKIHDNEIVAYDIDGTPIQLKDYKKRNDEAVVSFNNGDFKTKEQILSKYKNESIG